MKKIMIMACAVAIAAVAQAASVSWQIGYLEGKGAGGNGWSGSALSGENITAQLIVGSTFTDGVIGGLITDFDTDITKGAEDGYMFGYSESASMLTDTPYYAQVIIKDGDSILKSTVGIIEAGAANGGLSEPAFAIADEMMNITPATGLTFDSTYGTFSSAGWQAVPEPTSGLLMLVGLAGLALRRKRA